jgi:hypothetical protein
VRKPYQRGTEAGVRGWPGGEEGREAGEERRGEERRGEESLKRVKKRKYIGKKDKRTHQIGKNAKIEEEEQEERRGGEGSH